MPPTPQFTECDNHTNHICYTGEVYLHHSPLNEPFADGQTEHLVGWCDDCAGRQPSPSDRLPNTSVPIEQYTPSPGKACIEHNSTEHPCSSDYGFCYRKHLFRESNPTPCRFVRTYFKESDR
jgi:hypothetical protein